MKRTFSAIIFVIIGLIFSGCSGQASNVTLPQPQTEIQPAANPMQLEVLAQVGPWPVASRLIAYKGRLWFASSVKGVNHNSADIWSLDLATSDLRFERSLFSQDAGVPVVYQGLLYWPFEDALLSFGDGIIEATDGEAWQSFTIPGEPIYHTSEAIVEGDDLLVVAAAGDSGIYRSVDLGQNWVREVRHTAPPRKIARLKELTAFDDSIYAILRDGKKRRLARWSGEKGDRFEDILPWPRYEYINGLTVHKERLFALVKRGAEREIWLHDGTTSYRVGPTGRFVDLASDGDRLWAALRDGRLLSSEDGTTWQSHGKIEGGRVTSLHVVDGGLFAAGEGADGRSIIWGQTDFRLPADTLKASLTDILPRSEVSAEATPVDWQDKGRQIDVLLADADVFTEHQGEPFGLAIAEAIKAGPPRGFFADRLRSDIAAEEFPAFDGAKPFSSKAIAETVLLRSMAQVGHPDVPQEFLLRRWQSETNSYEKYFEPSLAAIHAVAISKQGDPQTVDTLLQRLEFEDDPLWLRSHIVGALTSATDKHFGYDLAAWRDWNAGRK